MLEETNRPAPFTSIAIGASLVVLAFVVALPGAATAGIFLPLGLGGGAYQRSAAYSVDGSGAVVVGIYDDYVLLSRRAFVWTPGSGVVELFGPADPGQETRAFAVSSDGQTIVGDAYGGGVPQSPVRWLRGTPIVAEALPVDTGGMHSASTGLSVSANGHVVAGSHFTQFPMVTRLSYPARWENGAIWLLPSALVAPPIGAPSILEPLNMGGVSDDGLLFAGDGQTEENLSWPFRWSVAGGYELLPYVGLGAGWVYVQGISTAGDAVVGNARVGNEYVAYLWRETQGAQLLGLLDPADDWSEAHSTTAHGEIVVGSSGTDLAPHGFIWDDVNGMRDLKTVLLAEGLPVGSWSALWPRDISPDGTTLVGSGYNPDGDIEGWIAYVPEPRFAHALVPGLAMLRMLGRRRAGRSRAGRA